MAEIENESENVDLLIKTHKKLRMLDEHNQVLKMHVTMLEEDNKKLTYHLDKVQFQKQQLLTQNQRLKKKIQQFEDVLKAQQKNHIENVHQIQKNQLKKSPLKENSINLYQPTEVKIKNPKTVQSENQYDIKMRLYKNRLERSSGSLNQKYINPRPKSPLIRQNTSSKQENLFVQRHEVKRNKKFNYTQWRRVLNDSTVWRNPTHAIVL